MLPRVSGWSEQSFLSVTKYTAKHTVRCQSVSLTMLLYIDWFMNICACLWNLPYAWLHGNTAVTSQQNMSSYATEAAIVKEQLCCIAEPSAGSLLDTTTAKTQDKWHASMQRCRNRQPVMCRSVSLPRPVWYGKAVFISRFCTLIAALLYTTLGQFVLSFWVNTVACQPAVPVSILA